MKSDKKLNATVKNGSSESVRHAMTSRAIKYSGRSSSKRKQE